MPYLLTTPISHHFWSFLWRQTALPKRPSPAFPKAVPFSFSYPGTITSTGLRIPPLSPAYPTGLTRSISNLYAPLHS